MGDNKISEDYLDNLLKNIETKSELDTILDDTDNDASDDFLRQFESELESEKPHKDMASVSKDRGCEEQISMFSPEPSPVLDKLRTLNLMEITPSQAIKILEELKSALDK